MLCMRLGWPFGGFAPASNPHRLKSATIGRGNRADDAYLRKGLDQTLGLACHTGGYTLGSGELDLADWIFADSLPFLAGPTDRLHFIALC